MNANPRIFSPLKLVRSLENLAVCDERKFSSFKLVRSLEGPMLLAVCNERKSQSFLILLEGCSFA